MANHTERMVTLLGAFRRERNGLVADTMHYDGRRYGLNYGVSLPTVRCIVRAEERDHEFARFLYGQQVRELQLAALHLADPNRLADTEEAAFWLSGVQNSELAEEAAFALLRHAESLPNLLRQIQPNTLAWADYALWMAAGRAVALVDSEVIAQTFPMLRALANAPQPDAALLRLMTQAAVFRCEQAVLRRAVTQEKMTEALSALGLAAWERTLVEEFAWRIEGA